MLGKHKTDIVIKQNAMNVQRELTQLFVQDLLAQGTSLACDH